MAEPMPSRAAKETIVWWYPILSGNDHDLASLRLSNLQQAGVNGHPGHS
jgi:hypothetical protein